MFSLSCLDFTQGKYWKWAKEAKCESKLPQDIKKWKSEADTTSQTLDSDLTEQKFKAWVVPYTDKNFSQAAIEWLVAMFQVKH